MSESTTTSGYVLSDGLEVYYELHGEPRGGQRPLVLLTGAFMTIGLTGPLVPMLAVSRQVVAVELQGHGHTADAERPLSYPAMADDVAALIEHLDLGPADVLGYSLGGGVALQLVLRHPHLVRRQVLVSVSSSTDGAHPELIAFTPQMTPEMFTGSPFEEEHLRLAPDPGSFPTLVMKIRELDVQHYDVPEADLRSIQAPTLLVVGDSDAIQLSHAVEFFTRLGGGVMGDLAGLPASRLAVLPGTTHFIPPGHGVLDRSAWLVPMVEEFLDTTELATAAGTGQPPAAEG